MVKQFLKKGIGKKRDANYYYYPENFGLTKEQFKNTVKECNFYDL